MTPTPRPKAVDIAFWMLVGGSVLLVVNGMMAVSLSFTEGGGQTPEIQFFLRASGILFVVLGAALGFLSGRTRQGDSRFRRAVIAFAAAIAIFVLGLAVLAKAASVIALVALLPIIFGALALTRPPVVVWFAQNDLGQEPSRG